MVLNFSPNLRLAVLIEVVFLKKRVMVRHFSCVRLSEDSMCGDRRRRTGICGGNPFRAHNRVMK